MRISEYSTMRRAVQSSAPAPDAAAVASLETELQAALRATGLFHTVEVGRTNDADRLVIALCEFAPEVDADEAARVLSRLWAKQVAYGFWRAEWLRVTKGHVELQGATRASLTGHYATMHLVAKAAPAPARPVALPARVRQIPSTGIGYTPITAATETARRPRRRLIGGRRAVA